MQPSLPGTQNPLIAAARDRRRATPLLAACFLALVFEYGSSALGALLTVGVLFPDEPDPAQQPALAAVVFLADLFFAFVPVLVLLWLWLHFFEGRSLRTLGLEARAGTTRDLASGAFVGVVLIAAVASVLALTGFAGLEGGHGGPRGVIALPGVLLAALAWAIQGSAEELLCRGWILQTATLRSGAWFGVLASAAVYVLLHVFTPGETPLALFNLFVEGIFFALYALYAGSLWGVCALHAAKNWAEVNLFGFDQSGEESAAGSIFNLRETGPDLLTGGDSAAITGGGLVYTGVLLIALTVMLVLFAWPRAAGGPSRT